MLASTMPAASCACVNGSTSSFSLIGSKRVLLHQVETREEKDPHQIDEMPVKTDHLDAVGEPLAIRGPHLVPAKQEIAEYDHAADHEETVKAGQREIHGHEVVRARKAVLHEFVRVLDSLHHEKSAGAQQRGRDVEPPFCQIAQPQMRPGHDHGDARSDE